MKHDVIGVEFVPSNLGLAALLEESTNSKALFIFSNNEFTILRVIYNN
ncbi:SidA/IucD/PvdA family monooxygenase [Priestia flexa]|nr:SidA/IucD/PvdA family monooxygenase [Priestia flexa]